MRASLVGRMTLGRVLVAVVVLTLGLIAQGGGQRAAADTAPPAGTPPTATADALPTWQVDGIVWSQAVVGNIVYATGRFSTARPPGVAKGGPGEVAVGNLIAYDIRTGNRVASFSHTLNGQGLVVHASQDGKRIYVGGDFTMVDGRPRGHVAAFDVATGALVADFAPKVSGTVRAIATDGPWVYLGGAFFYVADVYRQRLAAVSSFNGGLSAQWAPRASTSDVRSMVMAPDRSKLIVGGSFQTMSGVTANGQAAVHPTTGTVLPWAASRTITDYGNGGITSLTTDGTLVYGSGFAFGDGGRFEGSFAVRPADGSIVWVADCLGDTYSVYPKAGVLYTVGHAHDCTVLNSFGDTKPRVRWQRALAFTTAATGTITRTDAYGWDYRGQRMPSVLHWFPDLDKGTVSGQAQAGWSITGTGDYIAVAGEFPVVNNGYQQGLTRFALPRSAPLDARPRFTFTPTQVVQTVARAVAPGTVRVTFGTAWDRDNAELTYELYRNGTTKVASTKVASSFWTAPTAGLTDESAPTGTHTYRVKVTDPDGNTNWTTWSGSVQVSGVTPAAYPSALLRDDVAAYWRLDETSGSIAHDWTGGGQDARGTGSGVTWGAGGATGDGNRAAGFSGTAAGILPVTQTGPTPQELTLEAWFSTTTTTGGKLIGFGDSTNGSSLKADRHIYMDNAGRLDFGVAAPHHAVIRSSAAYNDGRWHHVAATLGPRGMAMYVDGTLVARDPSVTGGITYTGRWVLGGDTLGGWANVPTSRYFKGTLDDVAVYDTALDLEQIRSHVSAAGATRSRVAAPTDTYGKAVMGSSPTAFWRLEEASGTVAVDSADRGEQAGYVGTVTRGRAGAVPGSRGVAVNGTDSLVSSVLPVAAPARYSAELWFSSTSTRGGTLVDFGDRRTGVSVARSRSLQLLDTGRLRFTTSGAQNALTTPKAYNDGAWHHAVISQDGTGMRLSVDGVLVAQNTVAGDSSSGGYWRVGGDAALPGSTSGFVAASVDEVAFYDRMLTPTQVKGHYAASGRTAPSSPPVAAFSHAVSLSSVSVDASASSDADGPIASYAWTFGDGSRATGRTASHAYASAGTYPVTLTVTDGQGATASTTRNVTVSTPNRAPTAAFTATTPSELVVRVDGSGSSDPEGSIASHAWQFGDGATGTGATATHTYRAPGTYTVRLTVTDAAGSTATTTRSVTVTGPLARDTFTRSQTTGWGSAEVGGAWTLLGGSSSYSVGSGVGRFRMTAPGTGLAAQLGGVASTDTDLRATFSTSGIADGGGQYVFLSGRGTFNDGYRTKLHISRSGTLGVGLTRMVAGSETTLASGTSGLTVAPGATYTVRLQVVGSGSTQLRVKVWRSSQSEPSTWLLTAADSTTALQRAGGVGVRTYLSGSATNAPVTISFDSFTARPTQG